MYLSRITKINFCIPQYLIQKRKFSSIIQYPPQQLQLLKKRYISQDAAQKQIKNSIERRSDSSFDIFQKLELNSTNDPSLGEANKKRRPSTRVIKMVNDILSLSLIEAADLCELCQEALQSSSDKGLPPGRTPFPHPGGFFAGSVVNGMAAPLGHMLPYNTGNVTMQGGLGNIQQCPTSMQQSSIFEGEEERVETVKKAVKEKTTFNVRLQAYDVTKKISLVREIKAVLGLGLKEAKETVEAAPNVLKSNVSKEDALLWKEKFESAGATIQLE